MAGPLVDIKGVSKNYPLVSQRGDRLRALWNLLRGRAVSHSVNVLHDIDLCIYPGASLGLIGENGAGKSTLLKVITGVLKPSLGSVTLNGRIGALLELGAGFHAEHTGHENLFLAGALMGLSRKDIQARYDEILEFADIGDYIHEPIKHYSSGMVVRLGFALVAVTKPDLLITDEVLAVGDESFQRKCVQWIENYLGGGGTLLIVSHSMYHVQKLCKHAMWLKDGTIERYGDSYEVTQAYLAHHERKLSNLDDEKRAAQVTGREYAITDLEIDGASSTRVSMGDSVTVEGVVYSPDGREPIVMIGVLRVDGTPVYSTNSQDAGYRLTRTDNNSYRFAVRLDDVNLLPGQYLVRMHPMDPEAIRLFDPMTVELGVAGKTPDYGLCRIPVDWVRPGL